MEGLITNASKTANLKRDRCALITQQVNYDIVEMAIAEENAQNRFSQDPSDFSFQAINPVTEPESHVQPEGPVFEPIQENRVGTHNEWISRTANARPRRYF
jgi:hypothetical protein